MANLGYALMGGVRSASGEYAADQQKQRDFKLNEKQSDADLMRKQNFARFQVNIAEESQIKKEGRDKTALVEREGRESNRQPSGYTDPETQQPVTKGELAERPNGTQGLVPDSQYKSERDGDLKTKQSEKARQAKVNEIEKRFGKGTPEAEAAIGSLYGLAQRERTKGMSESEIRKGKTTYKTSIAKRKAELLDNTLEKSQGSLANLVANSELIGTLPEEVLKSMGKDKDIYKAVKLPKFAEQWKGLKKSEVKDKMKKAKLGGKPLDASDRALILEYMEYNEMLGGMFY